MSVAVQIIMVVLILILLIISIAVGNVLINYKEVQERRNYIEETKVHNEMINNTQSIYNALDEKIEVYLNEYIVINAIQNLEYIGDKEQNKMVEQVCSNIIREMSPIFLNQLSCYFNKEYIRDIIVRRVAITVAGVVSEHNSIPETDDIDKFNTTAQIEQILRENQ